jgi:hypothetical protein
MTTSSFTISSSDPHAISIARFQPMNWLARLGKKPPSLPLYLPLAPATEMLKLQPIEFDAAYVAQLASLNPRQVYNDLVALGGSECILCCYEAPNELCHRRLAASWLESSLGIAVPEIACEQWHLRMTS